jgi:AmpE protein
MGFFIILVCLSLERLFLIEPLLQREVGFNYYLTQIGRLIPLKWQRQPYGILFLILPALSSILILHMVSVYYFSKISLFLLEAVILFYCLGPINIYHAPASMRQDLFERAHTSFFSVLFWFALLGPVGALLFRLLERVACISMRSDSPMTISDYVIVVAKPLMGYFSWLPVRFFIGIQAVFGKFPETLRYWLEHLLTGWKDNDVLAAHSGRIALDLPIDAALDSDHYIQALSLFDKILLIFLGMMLVYTILSWVI